MSDARCPLCAAVLRPLGGALSWLAQCDDCGLALQLEPPQDAVASAELHYDETNRAHRDRIRPMLLRTARERWHWLARHIGPAARTRVLEVGCGTGEFLHVASRAGARVTGVEPSTSFQEAASSLYGLEMSGELLHGDSFAPGSFEAVVLLHVFEHLRDPAAFLEIAFRALAPGGWLFIVVPNLEGWTNRLYGAAAASLKQRDHLFHYTRDSLARMVERGGFRVQRVTTVEPAHHLWTAAYAWLAERRRGEAEPRRQDAEAAPRRRRWRSLAPFVAGRLTSVLTWLYRAWASARGRGHEVYGLFQKPADPPIEVT